MKCKTCSGTRLVAGLTCVVCKGKGRIKPKIKLPPNWGVIFGSPKVDDWGEKFESSKKK